MTKQEENPFNINPNQSYKQSEVAQLLDLSIGRLEHWRSTKSGPTNPGPAFVRIGRAISYLGSDLLKFVDQSRVSSSAEQTPS
jgi:hypothetical protein